MVIIITQQKTLTMLYQRVLKHIAYSHISIIKKYDFKGHNRFKNADKYIAQQNFEKIKNYKDFCTKLQQVNKVQLTITEQQQQYIHSTYLYERQDIAWTRKIGLPHYREDDHQLTESIENKTLLSFAKQGLKQRKPHQLLFWYGLVSIVIHVVLYSTFWYGAEDEDYIASVTLNPEFIETYNLKNCQPHIKQYKRKMGIQLQQILEINQRVY